MHTRNLHMLRKLMPRLHTQVILLELVLLLISGGNIS